MVATFVLHDQMEVLHEFAVHFTAIFILNETERVSTNEHVVLTY